jgi:hypothetical protein
LSCRDLTKRYATTVRVTSRVTRHSPRGSARSPVRPAAPQSGGESSSTSRKTHPVATSLAKAPRGHPEHEQDRGHPGHVSVTTATAASSTASSRRPTIVPDHGDEPDGDPENAAPDQRGGGRA